MSEKKTNTNPDMTQNKNMENLKTGQIEQGGKKVAITDSVNTLNTHLNRLGNRLGDSKNPNTLGRVNEQLSKLGGKIKPDGTLDIGQGANLEKMNAVLTNMENQDGRKFLAEHKQVEVKQEDGTMKKMYEGGKDQTGDVRHFLAELINGIIRIMRGNDTFGDDEKENEAFYERVGQGLSSKDKSIAPDQYTSVLKKITTARYKDIFEKRLGNADLATLESNQYLDQVMQDLGIDPKNKKAFCKIIRDIKKNEKQIANEVNIDGDTTVGDVLRALYGRDYGSASGTKSWGNSDEARNYKSDSSGEKYGTKDIIQKLGGSREAVERQLTTVNFLGANLKVSKFMAPALQNAGSEIKNYQSQHQGSEYKINPSKCGGYVWRGKANGGGGYQNVMSNPSNHATGLAIDLNRDDNPYMKSFKGGNRFQYCTLPPYFVEIMKKNGFTWGGDRNHPYDSMHFEYTRKDVLKI